MNIEALSDNWALLIAAVPAVIAVVILVRQFIGRTAAGQLRTVYKVYRKALKDLQRAQADRQKSAKRVEALKARADKTKPRLIQEAVEAAGDAGSLEKIAADKVLVTANNVRRIIYEEFPPSRQPKLRSKYLPQDDADGRPFTF